MMKTRLYCCVYRGFAENRTTGAHLVRRRNPPLAPWQLPHCITTNPRPHSVIKRSEFRKRMQSFNEVAFRGRVNKALETVQQILQRARHPIYAADASHTYTDKYVLGNLLVRLALSSTIQALCVLGLTEKDLGTLVEWNKSTTVSLRFAAEEKCTFVKETKREQESATRTETTGHVGSISFGSSSKTVTTITEYEWKYEGNYKIIAFRGVGADAADQ
eukprot:3812222-Rhodomonas_salina.1